MAFWRRRLALELDWMRILQTLLGAALVGSLLFIARFPATKTLAAPTGSDPGNWLAFAHELRGNEVRLAEGAYPPLVPFALGGLLHLTNPIVALNWIGHGAYIALAIAFFMLIRVLTSLPLLMQVGVSMLFSLAPFNGEAFAWGGFPQLAGLAFLLIASMGIEKWISSGRGLWGWAGAIFGAAVVYTHVLAAILLLSVMLIQTAWIVARALKEWEVYLKRLALVAGGIVVLSMLAIPSYLTSLQQLATDPTNVAKARLGELGEILNYVFRSPPALWTALLLLAVALPFLMRDRQGIATLVAITWTAILLFVVVVETRILHLLVIAGPLAAAMVLDHTWPAYVTSWLSAARAMALAGLLAVSIAIVVPVSNRSFRAALDWYQVVDADVLDGMQWLREFTPPETRIVATSAGPSHYPLGWWIEGYAQRHTLYAVPELRWVVFRQEREYAEVANKVFDSSASADEVVDTLRTHGAEFLFVDKSALVDDSNISTLVDKWFLVPVYENRRVLILEVSP
ncbi:MAG: hypothetical protein V3U32_07735 [Anaerolineales bacterium]